MVQHRKTRLSRAATRQMVTGIVVNRAPSLPRRDLERLEAILVNCVRRGPEAQNRAGHTDFFGHLQGRVSWVRQVRGERAAKLVRLFDAIVWPSAT